MTELSQRFAQAIDYARTAHAGQVRKGTTIPYVSHLLAVASLVLEHGGDEDQAIAGLLHDVIEDCGASHEAAIRERFGEGVVRIVLDCTDATSEAKGQHADPEAKRRDWWLRKLRYIERFGEKPETSLLVAACDKLHNARAIVQDLELPDPEPAVFDRFTAGRQGTLRYYESIARVLLRRNVPVAAQLDRVVARMHALAGETQRLPLDHGV